MVAINKNGRIKLKPGDSFNLPIGLCVLLPLTGLHGQSDTTVSICGLGSCIGLILHDCVKNIIAISHIMLPKCNGKAIYFPHKYANLSVEELLFEMIKEGSRNKDIRAIIIGGSTIFEIPMLSIGDQNIEIVKKELKSLGIKVEYEDTGGNIGRVINISAKSKKLLIRKAGKEIIRDLA